DTTIASWIGQNHDDPVSNFAAAEIGSIKHLPGAIWFDPDARTQAPGNDLLDTRLDNDWVISRTDWTPASTVVALRSGGPANHEHADRNSLIFKAHGERLFHDPFKAAYSPTHSRWLLRLTEAHTAVLVDGKGHQYHDGSEGTNASWAQANVTGYRAGDGALQVTSDATPAYQLINDKINRVDRTVLFLKPDVLLILDRLDMAKGYPAELTARFQIFNEDNQCKIAVRGQRFDIGRPFAGLQGQCFTRDGIPTLVRDQLDLPAEEGDFPFIAAMTRRSESDSLLTVVTAYPDGESASPLSVKSTATGWRIHGTHRGLAVDTTVDLNRAALPFT
ncbi:MAG: hypothetical protein HOH58_14640, partial [Opitutaceae bacterium]|nr:hypothetical protein [Opitutaceae bacterium]